MKSKDLMKMAVLIFRVIAMTVIITIVLYGGFLYLKLADDLTVIKSIPLKTIVIVYGLAIGIFFAAGFFKQWIRLKSPFGRFKEMSPACVKRLALDYGLSVLVATLPSLVLLHLGTYLAKSSYGWKYFFIFALAAMINAVIHFPKKIDFENWLKMKIQSLS